jgi:hypothetical protein
MRGYTHALVYLIDEEAAEGFVQQNHQADKE